MKTLSIPLFGVLCGLLPAFAQQTGIEPVRPSGPVLLRPYHATTVPPARLANSGRLQLLIRAGKLYLTAQDAIALAIEDNIDIENARYNFSLLAWNLERAQAGGALPGVPSGASQSASVASGQGVLGSQQAAGVNVPGSRGGSSGTTNATVSQVGPVTPVFDPSIQESTAFSHRSNPQANTVQAETANLVQGARTYTGTYQEGLITGGSLTINYSDHYLRENAPLDVLNPSVAPALSFSVQQNLLQGLGIAVSMRNINVAKINMQLSDLNFKTQVTGTVVNTLNAYYSLVAAYEDVRSKQDALETAVRFHDESKRRLDLGALSQLDVTTAQNQVAVGQLALVNSQATLQQQQLQLKNLISRTGAGDPLIAEAEIVPVDHLTIPATDNIPPIKDLVREALANRSDLLAEKGNLTATEISNIGTTNGLLPSAGVLASRSTQGLAGAPQVANLRGFLLQSDPYFRGGIGNALSQVFRQNFPTESVGAFGSIQIYDRAAEADYGIDQLSLRQQQLLAAKDMNQAQVDITNSVVALRQARARYEAAVQSRILQQQLLDAEEKKFNFGASTPYNVVVEQRDLAAAQSAELSSLATYQSARISLDQTTGATLEANHISLVEAEKGRLSEPSSIREPLPSTPSRN
ncbi:MAG TPA: TolC family protein [Bryobacteraceae bacterium]|jgi:outer membrane protein|nr:TolC family protein [Bryobacteraceae bacterium]